MNREILRLALPNILSNISVPLISSFDTALMGSLGGTHIAAVGLGSMAFNFVYWNFGFLRMGTTGLTAQAFGGESEAGQAQTLIRGALLALGIGVLLVILQQPLVRFTEWLLNIRTDQLALVEEYFYIRILAAPAALLQMVLLGWFFGRQNAVWPLLLTLVVNLANLGLSYYLVARAGWGISGVAWGTVAAQYFGLLLGIGFLVYGKLRVPRWPLSRRTWNPRAAAPGQVSLGAFFRINRDIFIRTVCLTLSFAFFYNRANALDAATATVAANVILLQLVNWLSYGVDGFAFAAESLVGKYAGAGDPARLHRAIRRIMAWGMGLAVIYALVYGLGGRALLALFAPEASAPETLAVALQYLPMLICFCILATPCYLLDGVFVGLTAARAMRQTMLVAVAGYLGAYYLVGQHFANWGLWGSLLFFMVLRAVLQWAWWRLGWVSEFRRIEAG
ncbi:MATE family multidrug resistance protein [Lewinella marina]|uniref:MATE family efflux transporter n=1 Tax=Neolewinella marina TaxID=438751 RepID=A0A2G0CB85_9BACT|nr:MATE family efflux transporter [Neolewinella marina]NJB87767.1 MATE family multidrug resistance protein [Neolewinella marina]PHK97238.1 MATE family efflux transporter [Neolewinella marina]